jgi:hypothetical protein
MRAKRKNVRELTERRWPNEQRARECWSYGGDSFSLRLRAMVVNLELLEPMVLVTMRPRPSRQVRLGRTRSEDHVSGPLLADCTLPA